MLNLQPVTLLPARERVAASLRKSIISRQLRQGDVLTLDATAKALGVSVTPVREAFQILARDNLIEIRQNKTAVVLGITEQTIRDHYQVRAFLESGACLLVCRNKADIGPVTACVDAARELLSGSDAGDYANLNQSFHYEIWKAAGNEKLKNLLSELWNGLSMGQETSVIRYAAKSQAEHEQILEALRAGDGHLAAERMYRHILRSMDDMLAGFDG